LLHVTLFAVAAGADALNYVNVPQCCSLTVHVLFVLLVLARADVGALGTYVAADASMLDLLYMPVLLIMFASCTL
jgi:hypothetical protein